MRKTYIQPLEDGIEENMLKWVVNIRLPYTYKDEVTADWKAQVEPVGIKIDDMDLISHIAFR